MSHRSQVDPEGQRLPQPSLPLEIVDQIFRQLREDGQSARPSLRACIHTCRAFASMARLHRYHTIVLGSIGSWWRLSCLIAANPSVASYVRTLRLGGYRLRRELVDMKTLGPSLVSFDMFTSVSDLVLKDMISTPLLLDLLHPLLAQIENIWLDCVGFADLLKFTPISPNLRGISISAVHWGGTSLFTPVVLPIAPKTALEHFTVDACTLVFGPGIALSPKRVHVHTLHGPPKGSWDILLKNLQILSKPF
jgi:hypothetical protein